MAARGRPFLLWAQPERRIPLWLSTLEQPQPSGLVGWVSAQTCSWQRCMHMGEGPPPLTPWPGAGEGRRDGGSGLGWVPCRTRPPRLRTAGGNSPPKACKKGFRFSCPPKFHHRRAVAPGMAWGAPEGWAGGPLRRQPELCSTTADPGEAWAGLGRAVGMGPACPVWRDLAPCGWAV